jgi:hypothetical protein
LSLGLRRGPGRQKSVALLIPPIPGEGGRVEGHAQKGVDDAAGLYPLDQVGRAANGWRLGRIPGQPVEAEVDRLEHRIEFGL